MTDIIPDEGNIIDDIRGIDIDDFEEAVDFKTMNDLLKLRALLQSISNFTFNYSVLNKKHPIYEIKTKAEALDIIDGYTNIIEEINLLIKNK